MKGPRDGAAAPPALRSDGDRGQRGADLCALPLFAANQVVTSLADSGAGSLRAAIAAVGSGETITFAVTGMITLASELAIDKSLTIQGPGASQLTVSGNNSVRVFNIGSVTPPSTSRSPA